MRRSGHNHDPEYPQEWHRRRRPLRASSSSSSPDHATQTHPHYDQPLSYHGSMTDSRSRVRRFNANFNGVGGFSANFNWIGGFNGVGSFTDPSSWGMMDMDMGMGRISNSSGSVNSNSRVSTTRRHHPTRYHHRHFHHHYASMSARNENYHTQASTHSSRQSRSMALHQSRLNPPRSMGVSEMSRPTYRRRSSNSNGSSRSWQSYQGESHHSSRSDWRSWWPQSHHRQSTRHRNEGQWRPRFLDQVAIADQMSFPPSETYPDNNILRHLVDSMIDGGAIVQDVTTMQTYTQNNLRGFRTQLRDVMQDESEILQDLAAVGNFSLHGPNVRSPTEEDINMMSYEELLELTEEIGNENIGLPEETILEHLKKRVVCSSTAEKTQEMCSVCQSEYKNQEKIGTIDCGHEYHVDCIKDWLLVKNDCPICRKPALKV